MELAFKQQLQERFIMACQDHAITTNPIKVRIFHQAGSASCHLCGLADETVDHLLTSCSVIVQFYYKKRHNAVAKIIHWELSRVGGIDCAIKYWMSMFRTQLVTEMMILQQVYQHLKNLLKF